VPRSAAEVSRSGMQGLGAAALASVGVSSERAVCVPGAASSLTPGDEHTHVVACSRELEVWQSCVSALSSAVVPSDKGVRLSEVASAGSALLRQCGINSSGFCAPGRPLTSGKEVACGMN